MKAKKLLGNTIILFLVPFSLAVIGPIVQSTEPSSGQFHPITEIWIDSDLQPVSWGSLSFMNLTDVNATRFCTDYICINLNATPIYNTTSSLGTPDFWWKYGYIQNLYVEKLNNGIPTTGTGEENALAKWTTKNTLGPANIYDINGAIGINTKNPYPSYALTVNGIAWFTDDIYVSGDIGINTHSPEYDLDVRGNASVSENLYTNNLIAQGYIELQNLGTTLNPQYALTWSPVDKKVYYTSLIYTDGNYVGINTETPQTTLDVNGSILIEDYNYLYLGNTNGKVALRNYIGDLETYAGDNPKFYFGFSDSDKGTFYIRNRRTGSTIMVIKQNATVGINTTAPVTTLDVYGNARISNILSLVDLNLNLTQGSGNYGYPALLIKTPAGSLEVGPQNTVYTHFVTTTPYFWFNKPIYINGGQISSYWSDLYLQTQGVTRIFADRETGYVGINTTNPEATLDVNGNVSIRRELNMNNNNINDVNIITANKGYFSIIYDKDNPNYYLDAASTSQINNINLAGTLTSGIFKLQPNGVLFWSNDSDYAKIYFNHVETNRNDLYIYWADDDTDRLVFLHHHWNNGDKVTAYIDRNNFVINNNVILTNVPEVTEDSYVLTVDTGGNVRKVNYWDVYGGYWNLSDNNLYPKNLDWNVGIGTSTPAAKLHVNGTVRVDGALNLVGNVLYFGESTQKIGDGGAYIYFGDNAEMVIHTEDTLEGNVGIGTTNPQAKLHIVGGSRSSSFTTEGIIMGKDQSGNYGIEFVQDGGTPYIDFTNDVSGTDYDARIRLTNDDTLAVEGSNLYLAQGSLIFSSDKTHAIQLPSSKQSFHIENYQGKFRIVRSGVDYAITVDGSTGKIGIWNDNPEYKLDVAGSMRAGGSNGKIYITDSGDIILDI